MQYKKPNFHLSARNEIESRILVVERALSKQHVIIDNTQKKFTAEYSLRKIIKLKQRSKNRKTK